MSAGEVSRDDPRHGLWSLRAAAQVVNIGDILIDVKVFWSGATALPFYLWAIDS